MALPTIPNFLNKAAGYTPIGFAMNKATGAIGGGGDTPWGSVGRGYMSGGIPGAIGGYFAGKEEQKADAAQQQGIEMAMAQQERIRQEQLAMRQKDLQTAMGFFNPAQQFYSYLYGIPMEAWGPQGGGMPMPGAQGGGYTMTPQAKQGAANARAAMQPKDLPPVAMDPISADQVQRLKSMFAGQKRGY